jgi:hypothetical protein
MLVLRSAASHSPIFSCLLGVQALRKLFLLLSGVFSLTGVPWVMGIRLFAEALSFLVGYWMMRVILRGFGAQMRGQIRGPMRGQMRSEILAGTLTAAFLAGSEISCHSLAGAWEQGWINGTAAVLLSIAWTGVFGVRLLESASEPLKKSR